MIEKEETDLIFLQEPYEYQNRPVGMEKKYRIFTARNGKHRAASMYFDIDDQIENKFTKIDAILQFAKGEKL